METIVDPLSSVNSKYNFEKVNNPEKFTKLLIKNYNKDLSMRATASAITTKNAGTPEFKDPIIYSTHPSVASLAKSKSMSGAAHDHENAVSSAADLDALQACDINASWPEEPTV